MSAISLRGKSGNDTVHEGSANIVVLFKPLLESFIVSSEIILPKFDVLLNALLQVVTIEEDEFARHDDETLRGAAVESLIAAIEQLHEFAGIAAGRSIREFAGGIESDTSLCRVGDDKTNLWLVGQCHECCILAIGIEGTADDVDTCE